MSDGSLKKTYGTSAAIFMGTEEDNRYSACNRTPGATRDQSSFRSELCGILSNAIMLNIIAEIHGIHEGTVIAGCDNESALWQVFGDTTTQTSDSSFDIIKAIRYQIRKSPITWIPRHVRGHQDDQECIQLDDWAKANVEADKMAEKYWTAWYQDPQIPRQRPRPPRMPGEGWRIKIKGRPITQKVEEQIHEHAWYDRMMTYWEKRTRIQPGLHEHVAWDHYNGALKQLIRSKRQWVHKHHCGWEGTNYMMFHWKQRATSQCPRCPEVETHRHIMRCQSSTTTT